VNDIGAGREDITDFFAQPGEISGQNRRGNPGFLHGTHPSVLRVL
jgi:hypothetical protein